MKIITDVLRNTTITTEAGNFKVDANGIVDVPDEVAKELIDVGSFTTVETESKAVKEEAKEDSKTEEPKADNKKSK